MIENVRDVNTSFEAVYFLTARPEVIKCVLHDFRPDNMLYAAAHLFFLDAASDDLVGKLSKIGNHVRTLREIFIDFTPQESQVFTTHDHDATQVLFNSSCGMLVEPLIKEMAMRLVCMCAMLGEYPIIRYYRPTEALHAARSLSAKLANTVQAELDNHARNNEGFPPKSDRPRGVLFITDRSMDLFAPLVHEFTYQAMANDLLPIREGTFYEFNIGSGPKSEQIQEVISEKDTAWMGVRHLHMSLAIDQLVQQFNKFTQDNADFNEDTKTTNLNTIRNMLAGMDSYAQGKDKYSLYITMAQDCMAKFEKHQLPVTGQLEQDCATGMTSEGRFPKNILETMVPLLDDDLIPMEDKTRMLMIYIIFKCGIFPDDRTKLIRHAKIVPLMQEAIFNLDLLGVPKTKTARNKKRKDRKSAPPGAEESFELSRFAPALKTMVEDHFRGTLDSADFPYTRDIPVEPERNTASGQGSLRTNRPAWAKGRTHTDVPRQRVIVFVAGGATYSEVRSVYELSEAYSRDVVLGSSSILTPSIWLDSLAKLRRDRAELNLASDTPPPKIPLLEQRDPAPAQQTPPSSNRSRTKAAPGSDSTRLPQSPSPSGNRVPSTGKIPPSRPANMPDILRDTSTVTSNKPEDKEKKKKFGLFGKKK